MDEKVAFEMICQSLEILFHIEPNFTNKLAQMLQIVDLIENAKHNLSEAGSMKVTKKTIIYLRVSLSSNELHIVKMTLILIDILVKNGGYHLHVAIGNKKFMKAMTKNIIQLSASANADYRIAGILALDIMQGWGEAFTVTLERIKLNPFIAKTYHKLRFQYGFRYPRLESLI